MKKYIVVILFVLISCKDEGDRFKKYHDVLYEGQCIAVPEYYRPIIGYDSVQFIDFMDRPEANFCYPNKWADFSVRKDTVFVRDTVVVYDIPKRTIKRKLRRTKCNDCDTVFTMFPLYIDSTTIPGKRIIKIKK